jgi:predicted O-methyltransferase YrrM
MNPVRSIYRAALRVTQSTLNTLGINIVRTRDFYSPLPVLSELRRTRHLWDRPSELVGVDYDLEELKSLLSTLLAEYGEDYKGLPPHDKLKKEGFGPGFPVVDAMVLYLMMRHLKPRRYVEIGSGLSTYHAILAAKANNAEGRPCMMRCVDPFPRSRLQAESTVKIFAQEVQEIEFEFFDDLDAGDVLFIDTTHVLKVGGELTYLFAEILPRLKSGVWIHVHDIHFPYNTPYPAEMYVFRNKWPWVFTEPVLLQAFLAFNSEFKITMSTPLIRFHDEKFLADTVPDYKPVEVADFDTHFGSVWFKRI